VTTLRNNFDGGPDGTAITAANSDDVPGNDAFQVVSPTGSGSMLHYTDAVALGRGTAEYVMEISTSTTANDNAVIWSTAMGTQTQVWWREYVYLTAFPGGATRMTIFESDNGAVYTGHCEIGTVSGKLYILNGARTSSQITTNSLPINEWVRVEGRYLYSTTVGSAELNLYLDPDSDTPDETISGSGWNMGAANSNSFAFGSAFAVANKPTTYFSGLELNNTGWPGPAPFKVRGVPGILTNPIAVHSDTR
jgi:hypothetical protein